jgi:hypothetical protein
VGAARKIKAVLEGTQNVVKLVGDDVVFEIPKGFTERLYRKIYEK